MSRIERLVNLVSALLETERPLSREAIRERVPGYPKGTIAYRRAFERDKETLRATGIPLATEELDESHPEGSVGYRIPKTEYALPDPQLTREEMDALTLAASIVRLADSGDQAEHALVKLGAELRGRKSDRSTAMELVNDDRLATMFAARSRHAPVSFRYRDKSRTLEPHQLACRNGHWYVTGHDHTSNESRTFRLDRIEGDIVIGAANSFDPPPTTQRTWAASWEMGEESVTQSVVAVDAAYVPIVRRMAPELVELTSLEASQREALTAELAQIGTEIPRDAQCFVFSVSNTRAFFSFVLSFLDHAEILSPSSLRQRFVQHVTATCHHHQQSPPMNAISVDTPTVTPSDLQCDTPSDVTHNSTTAAPRHMTSSAEVMH